MSGLPGLCAMAQPYDVVLVLVSSAAVVLVFLGCAWLAIQPSKHRRTKMALLGAELAMLGALAWVDLAADAQIRAHARRLACHARLEKVARLLTEARELGVGRPRSFPRTLDGIAIVPEFRTEDLRCPMDDAPYDYEVSRDGAALVTGRAVARSPFGLARGFHTLRVDARAHTIEWTEVQR